MRMLRPAIPVISTLVLLTGLSHAAAITKEETFWRWFQTNENSLYSAKSGSAPITNSLMFELEKVDENLSYMLEAPDSHGRRAFIISADGFVEAFPIVEALHATAPDLPRWTIVKFRQREVLGGGPIVSFVNGEAQSGEMRYILAAERGMATIHLFLPGANQMSEHFSEHSARSHLVDFLGEEDFGKFVEQVSVSDVTHEDYDVSKPVADLPAEFDAAFKN